MKKKMKELLEFLTDLDDYWATTNLPIWLQNYLYRLWETAFNSLIFVALYAIIVTMLQLSGVGKFSFLPVVFWGFVLWIVLTLLIHLFENIWGDYS